MNQTKREQAIIWLKGGGNLILLRNVQAYITVATRENPEAQARYMGMATEEAYYDLILPLLDDSFTEQELIQINAFYDSPLGKKITEITPDLSTTLTMAGRTWGSQIAEKLSAEFPTMTDAVKNEDVAAELARLERIDHGQMPGGDSPTMMAEKKALGSGVGEPTGSSGKDGSDDTAKHTKAPLQTA